MTRSKKLFPLFIFIFAALACVVPGLPAPGADTAAETPNAMLTLSVTDTFTPTLPPTLTRTFTPTLIYPTSRFPSATPTEFVPTQTGTPQTSTPSPVPSDTPIPAPVTIRVTSPTHCRSGPGKVFDIVGSLLVGMKAVVIGRDPTNQYYYIENPYVYTDYCWVWGQYAEFEGDPLALPALTPPPTPTATFTPIPTLDFKVKAGGFQTCSGSFWVNIEITNNSKYVFESVHVLVYDKDRNVTRVLAANDFSAAIGCDGLTVSDRVSNGALALISTARFNYNFKGDTMQVQVTVCTKDKQEGICTMKEITLVR
jgi:hypothetical protein